MCVHILPPSTAVSRHACGRPRRGAVAAVLPHWSHDDGRLPGGRLTLQLPPPANGHGRGALCERRNGTASAQWAPRLPGQPASRLHLQALVRTAFDHFDPDRRGIWVRHADTHAQANSYRFTGPSRPHERSSGGRRAAKSAPWSRSFGRAAPKKFRLEPGSSTGFGPQTPVVDRGLGVTNRGFRLGGAETTVVRSGLSTRPSRNPASRRRKARSAGAGFRGKSTKKCGAWDRNYGERTTIPSK